MSSAREVAAFHVPVPVPSPLKVLHVLNKLTPVAAGIGDCVGRNLVLHPLGAVVNHVPVAGPLAIGVTTKIILPGSRLAVHSVVTADHLAIGTIHGGEKVAAISVAVARPVASGVTWTAGQAGVDALDLRFLTAQTTLAGVNQAEKLSRVADAVQVAGGYASQTMNDIGNARLGHAAQDLTELVASEVAAVSEERIQQTAAVLSDARGALAANLEAIGCVRQGQWTRATAAMGRGMTAAGGAMSVAGHMEMGFAITQGGHAIEAEAPYTARLAQVLARKPVAPSPGEIIQTPLNPKQTALALSQSAMRNARAGKFQEATLQATMAVALVSSLPKAPGDKTGDAAVLWAQAALADAQAGRYGIASANAGDALSAAGQTLSASDPGTGWALTRAGASLQQYAAAASANAARQDIAAAK